MGGTTFECRPAPAISPMLIIPALAALLASAGLLVSALRPKTALSFVLGVYLTAWSLLVVAVAMLSLGGLVNRRWLCSALAVILVAAAVLWFATGRRRPPPGRSVVASTRSLLGEPVLAVLAVSTVIAAVYVVVVGLTTPQNEWDSLTYHLTRAAFWLQQGSVSYIPRAADVRVNGNPPVAEIGLLATLALRGNDSLAWLPQFSAVVALCLAAYGTARRLSIGTREALFGALVLGCLPLVALQASTALNDIVVASFLLTATYFALGTGRRSAAAAAGALGLALGSKVLAVFLLPVYLVVVVVSRRRASLEQIVILLAGTAAGSVWYVVNLIETGRWDGGLADATDQIPDRSPLVVISRAVQLATDALGLPGAVGADVLAYPLIGLGFAAVVGVLYLTGRRMHWRTVLLATVIVALVPVTVWCIGRGTTSAWRFAWVASGRAGDETVIPAHFTPSRLSDSTATWFGPVGALLVLVGIVLAVRSHTRDRATIIACAVAPLILLGVIAVAVPYDPWRGRFFVYAMGLASVAWALSYRVRALAWGVALASAATTLLVLTHSYTKPPGLRLLEPTTTPSVFGKPRWQVQTWIRRRDGTDETVRYVERNVPSDATVGVVLGIDDFVFPYFGRQLTRSIVGVDRGARAPAGAEWLIQAPGKGAAVCRPDWTAVLTTTSGYRVLRRTRPDTC